MAYTTINKSTDYFNTKIYTGDGTNSHAITGVGFQPDWTWIKDRDDTSSHLLTDAVRGATKGLKTNGNDGESTGDTNLKSFDSDGFTVGSSGRNNQNGASNVSWNWKANGAGSANTDGSINTTATSANTTAGFSISKYTGTGSSATIGHGLAASPNIVLIKMISSTDDWSFQTSALGYSKYLVLNGTGSAPNTSGALVSSVSSTTVTVDGNAYVNSSGATYVMYCFSEKSGYSKFGTYTGNGSTDGTFIYTGFKPTFVIFKRSSGTGGWIIHDNKRSESNGGNSLRKYLVAQTSGSEGTNDYFTIDTLSNGFKLKSTDGESNQSGQTYIYMAFGQSIVGSNNIPATAR